MGICFRCCGKVLITIFFKTRHFKYRATLLFALWSKLISAVIWNSFCSGIKWLWKKTVSDSSHLQILSWYDPIKMSTASKTFLMVNLRFALMKMHSSKVFQHFCSKKTVYELLSALQKFITSIIKFRQNSKQAGQIFSFMMRSLENNLNKYDCIFKQLILKYRYLHDSLDIECLEPFWKKIIRPISNLLNHIPYARKL